MRAAISFLVLLLLSLAIVLYAGIRQLHTVEAQLRDNPILVEKLGIVSSVNLDLPRSAVIAGGARYVYDVRGELGRGWVYVHFINSWKHEIGFASLHLPSGEAFHLHVVPGFRWGPWLWAPREPPR